MSFSAQVLHAIRQVQGQFPVLDLGNRAVFMRNLTFVYHVIKGSENLLKVAAQYSKDDALLHPYFIEHLAEERAHEQWLAADLLTAGVSVQETMIPRAAVELVGSQYYLIQHVDPAALLGYMAVLECFPTPECAVHELEKVHGTDLLRTLRYHAEHDVQHGGDVLKIIDLLAPERQHIVLQSAVQSALYFAGAMASLA